ncbi:MAG: hypothetical protein J7M19_08375 [Planctomycetes bacterium]|nr:hypothetical protein [Planctomycetota bacterium]
MARLKPAKLFKHLAPWALFAGLALAVTAPMLWRISWWGVHDWAQFYSYYGVPKRAVAEYHELPGWNPYYYGGNVQWGHPDDPTLSVLFLPVLFFGEVAGSKIDIVLVLVGGMYSMWLLARRIGVSVPGRIFAAAVWALNGWHAYHFAVGHMDHLTFLFVPLAVFFLLKATDSLKWAAASGAVIALMYLSGGPYPFIFTSLLVVVIALLLCGAKNSARPLWAVLATLAFAGGLSAVKFLPTWEFARMAGTVPADISGTPPAVLWRGLFDSSLPMPAKYAGLRWGAWEYAAFIGWIPAVAFLAGAVAAAPRAWPWVAVGVVFLVASLGSASPVDVFALLTVVPGLSGMHVPFRFIVHFILAVALVGGMGLDVLYRRLLATRLRAAAMPLAVLVAAAAAGNLVWMHYNRPVSLYGLASYYPVSRSAEGGPSRELTANEEAYIPATHSNTIEVYRAFLDGRRLSWGYDAVHLPEAAHFPGQSGYRGEAYLANDPDGRWLEVNSTLSTYRVTYDAQADDVIVLNQNYHPGWKAVGAAGGAFDSDGLVAAKVGPGHGAVVFRFRPASRFWGGLITALAIVVACLAARSKPAESPSTSATS